MGDPTPGPLTRLAKRALLVPGSPIDLAVVRVVFFAYAFTISASRLPEQMAALPEPLRLMPTGAAWLYALVPVNANAARIGSLVMVATSILGLLGVRARVAALVWAVMALYVMGIPHLFGKVNHDHHVLWFALLLAASPCADALSLDAIRSRARTPDAAVRYGFPLRVWWLLIGLLYFFPGLWKLLTQGLGWASPANLRPLLHGQWAAVDDFEPLIALDHWPAVLIAIGVGTIVFELGFVVAVFTRLRPFAVAAGIGFHVATLILLNIGFTSLVLAYVAFIPWSRSIGNALNDDLPGGAEEGNPTAPSALTAALLVAGAMGFGAMNVVEGWPFAAYPTFADRYSGTRTELILHIENGDGSTREADLDDVFSWVPDSRRGRLVGRFGDLPPAERQAVLSRVSTSLELPEDARSIVVTSVRRSTDPDNPRVLETRVLYTVDLPLPDE